MKCLEGSICWKVRIINRTFLADYPAVSWLGILMMKLWLWIDKKNDCGKAGEK
jgi:hypothetical protein